MDAERADRAGGAAVGERSAIGLRAPGAGRQDLGDLEVETTPGSLRAFHADRGLLPKFLWSGVVGGRFRSVRFYEDVRDDDRSPLAMCAFPRFRRTTPNGSRRRPPRVGAATLDYVLALGIVLPLLVVILPQGRRAMQLVFEMTTTLTAWPFL